VLVACAVRGFMLRDLYVIERIVTFAAGLLFIAPGVTMPGIGLVILLGLVAVQRIGPLAVVRSLDSVPLTQNRRRPTPPPGHP